MIHNLHARQLTHIGDGNFVADASTLMGHGIVLRTADIIRVTNHGTRDYRFVRNVFNGQGDDRELAGWVYQSEAGGTVTVFNT
jgi:hypothetical protein